MIITTIIVICIIFFIENSCYKKSSYYKVTHQSYLSVLFDKGTYGEYLIYKRLKPLEAIGAKFLFNVYIPKDNSNTTEIDMIMICPKGIFVFESKNYSGWIFGSEDQKNWYQILPAGRGRSNKEHFYNPVMQNASHIKHLTSFLNKQIPTQSIIVFSDRCAFKNLQIHSSDVRVIHSRNINNTVSTICAQSQDYILSEYDISDIYNRLYPFTQADKFTKMQHIASIQAHANTSHKNTSQSYSSNSQYRKQQSQHNIQTKESKFENYTITVNDSPSVSNRTQQKLKCPRCNGDLKIRTSHNGENNEIKFYGCSNYPKCKYTQKIH